MSRTFHTVTLGAVERAVADTVAAMRQANAERLGLADANGLATDAPLRHHVLGARGELAVAKHLGRYWRPTVGTFKTGDDGAGCQVRTRSRHGYDLLLRPDDDPDQYFAHVTSEDWMTFRLWGYALARAVMLPELMREHGGRSPAYFVPADLLEPFPKYPTGSLARQKEMNLQ